MYVETELPPAAQQAGCFTVADLAKQGDGFAGNVKHSCVCQYVAFWRGMTTERFSGEAEMQITSVTPTRIEGWFMTPPKDAKLDCEKGSYTKPFVRQSFVWIPESK